MNNLHIEHTKYTFKVDFNANSGILEMSGSSYPEDAIEFFQPIFNWIKKFISEVNKSIVLNLKFDYMNTSSSKCILDIFEILEKYHNEDNDVQINWYYEVNDEDMQETGEEFAEDIKLPFKLIAYKRILR